MTENLIPLLILSDGIRISQPLSPKYGVLLLLESSLCFKMCDGPNSLEEMSEEILLPCQFSMFPVAASGVNI